MGHWPWPDFAFHWLIRATVLPWQSPAGAVGRGSRGFPTKGARQWAGDSAGSQAQGRTRPGLPDPAAPAQRCPQGMGAAAAPGASLGDKGQHRWGGPGAQPPPEPSSHRAPAAFHPGPDISTCRAFGKRHFNALAVKAVENVRGLVQEGSREGAAPWVCRGLAEPCQGSWGGVGSCGAPGLSRTPLRSLPALLIPVISAAGVRLVLSRVGSAAPRGTEGLSPLSPHLPLALPPASMAVPPEHFPALFPHQLQAEGLPGHLFFSDFGVFFFLIVL